MSRSWCNPCPVLETAEGDLVVTRNIGSVRGTKEGSIIYSLTGATLSITKMSPLEIKKRMFSLWDDDDE